MKEINLNGIILSDEEKRILNKLMSSANKKVNTKVPISKHLKEYINRYEIHCQTCKLVYFESYYMEPDKETGALMGLLMPEGKVTDCCDIRTSTRSVITCNSCTERLMKLDKEVIIKLYLKEKYRWT